jgi:menaquinone-specific isochorismate synthase
MLDPAHIRGQLDERLAAGVEQLLRRADADTAPALVSLILRLPRLPTGAPQLSGQQFQLVHADQGTIRAGYGCALEREACGPERLQRLATEARALSARWQRLDLDGVGLDAFALLGFAAGTDGCPPVEDHMPNSLLWVPEVGLHCADGQSALILSAAWPLAPAPYSQEAAREIVLGRWREALDPLVPALYQSIPGPLMPARLWPESAEPGAAVWARMVDAALAEINDGDLAKVVLSRRVDVTGSRRFDVGRLLGALGCLFPSCQVINLRRNGASFVAATPERLLSLNDGRLEVDAIAGTAARAETTERDAELAAALLASEKNLREHRFVVDAIRAALSPCCDDIAVPDAPRLMQLNNAQHLWSPIQALPAAGVDLFQLAERLHPTPATNGDPRQRAREWLAGNEPIRRGWYTGAAGYITPELTGELWVLLRCARVQAERAELYAGAGIIAGSDAETEWDETEAKLGAMLSALRYA